MTCVGCIFAPVQLHVKLRLRLQVMMDIYSSLARCDEFLGLSRSERFFTTINGRWCFIPMLPCFPSSRRWQLPRRCRRPALSLPSTRLSSDFTIEDIQALASCSAVSVKGQASC